MAVSTQGAFLGTKVDPSVRIIHLYKQAKRGAQLQAMLNAPAYIDDKWIWPFPNIGAIDRSAKLMIPD
jgi:hypothetical protein